MSEFPHICTFYSFKGGVGRSMAVLNVAYALAGRGRHVLVLDMDLEAPGLSGFLHRHQEIIGYPPSDMIDLVQWSAQAAAVLKTGEKLTRAALPPLSEYTIGVTAENLERLRPEHGELGRVDVIPVDDRRERDYYARLTKLGIGGFDRDTLRQMGSVLKYWLKHGEFAVEVPEYYGDAGERTAKYDYVLVDSRTGVTEIGGLCIGPLSDRLLVFTGLNDQNIAGTQQFLREVGVLAKEESTAEDETASSNRLDPKPTMIVATPVPSGELEAKKERLDELARMVGSYVGQLSYHPQLALMETIFVRDYPQEYLALEYIALVDRLMRQVKDGTDLDWFEFMNQVRRGDLAKRRELLRRAIRGCSAPGGSPMFLHPAREGFPPDSLTDDQDFVLLDRVCRMLVGFGENINFDMLNNWANYLSAWALHTDDLQLRDVRFQTSLDRYTQVLNSPQASAEQKAQALYNRGVRKGQLQDHAGAIADYTAVLEMPDAPAEQKAKALSNRGWRLYEVSKLDEAINDYHAAIDLDEKFCNARGNLAVALLVGGRQEDALETFRGALELAEAKHVADMEQDLDEALRKHASLDGADQVREMLANRRAELERQ